MRKICEMKITIDAMEFPADMHKWNRALAGAFRKGVASFQKGQSIHCCLYADIRTNDGRLSWSRSFRNAWFDGWHWAKAQITQTGDLL